MHVHASATFQGSLALVELAIFIISAAATTSEHNRCLSHLRTCATEMVERAHFEGTARALATRRTLQLYGVCGQVHLLVVVRVACSLLRLAVVRQNF